MNLPQAGQLYAGINILHPYWIISVYFATLIRGMKVILALLCCFELLLVTYLVNFAGPFVSPVLFLGTSIAIAFVYLHIASQPNALVARVPGKIPALAITAAQWAVFLGGLFFIVHKLKYIWWYKQMYGYPGGDSDIIPQIQVLVQRFLAGEQPYSDIQFKGYVLFPTYMPFQWLPYVPCELLQKDFRWIPLLGMGCASLYYFLHQRRMDAPAIWKIIVPSWPLLVWCATVLNDNNTYVFTVEGLIAAYYLFVAESINRRNILLLASGVAICLLSRYSIIFWMPLCIVAYFIGGEKKNAAIVAGMAVLFIVVFYWAPYLRHDHEIFIKGYRYHTSAAKLEWQKDISVGDENYLENGLGFTSYAITWFKGEVAAKLAGYKVVHFAMCIMSVVLLCWYYVRNRARYSVQVFLLFSFKIYIAVFYAFIQIPYRYLYLTPLVITAALIGGAFFPKPVKDNPILR